MRRYDEEGTSIGYGWYGRNRETQLGVAEKTVNGKSVGFMVGYICGDRWIQNVRKDVVYQTEAEARAVLETLESNTHERQAPEFKVLEKGKTRFS